MDHGIYQANVVFHTGADGFSRLARQARFDGAVSPDCDYVLVDDVIGMGGTLANMKGHIESKGGRVLAAVCSLLLTGKPHSAKLTPSPERLSELRGIHGTELENWFVGGAVKYQTAAGAQVFNGLPASVGRLQRAHRRHQVPGDTQALNFGFSQARQKQPHDFQRRF